MRTLHAVLLMAAMGTGVAMAGPTNTPVRLPEVNVTSKAKGIAINPQAVPAAVAQVDAERIQSAGVTTIHDLAAEVPGLSLSRSVARSFGDVYSVRGIANSEFFSAPALVLYVDDAPAGDVMTYPVDLMDIQNVDIWRGPQGSLFGKNSAAGVIDITTRRPTDKLEASASASYASRDTELYRASVGGALVPGQLRFSLSGGYGNSDGFVENPLLGSNADRGEDSSGRLRLGWTPSQDWDLGFTATAEKYHDGVRLVPLDGDPHEVSSDLHPTADAEGNGQALRIQRSLPGATLTSITTRRDFNLDPLLLDLDLSPMPGNTALIRQDETFWSEELRLQSAPDADVWQWRGGLFFSTATRNGDDTRDFIAPVAPGVFLPVSQRTQFELGDDNYAAFGQATYAGLGRLGITLGARLDYTEKSIERSKTATPGFPVPATDDSDSFFTAAPKLTVDYRCADHILGYISSGLGFKPGGFSAYIDPPAEPSFDTERNWASEAGVKTAWQDKKLLANVAVFYNDIEDYQVEKALIGSTDLTIVNAPEATTQGIEAEVVARPLAGLELSASAAYTDAQFDRFTSPDTGADLEGNRPPYIPELSALFAAQYKAACGGFARVECQVNGKTHFDEANTDALTESSYSLVHARVGFEGRDFTVALFGSNLTDEDYFTRRLMVAVPAGVPGEPQTFGITASMKY